jgi:hypothetical protein
VGSEL